MFCSHCGKEIMDEAEICPNCGCETETKKTNSSPTQKTESSTIGILAITFSILGGIFGLILSLVGWTCYDDPENVSLCKTAFWISMAWIIIPLVGFILYTLDMLPIV